MLKIIDSFLNNITMYRVVLYGLVVITGLALLLGLIGGLPFSGLEMLLGLVVVTTVAFLSNTLLAKAFNAVTNYESWLITALILFLILPPITNTQDALFSAAATLVAMASKYMLVFRKKHLFNPAAIGVLLAGYLFHMGAIWWVGSFVLLPVTAIVGLLVVRKIRRFSLFFSFVASGLLSIVFFGWLNGADPVEMLKQAIVSWPVLFFGTFMLTEPLTTPPTRNVQVLYGVLVGFLFGLPLRLGLIHMAPELALVLGNIFSYLVSPKQKLILTLKKKMQLAPTLYDFLFEQDQQLAYQPGQYLEWTLPIEGGDDRGNRRYFTIASSPTEAEIRLAVKIPESPSVFKSVLKELKKGDQIQGSQLAGDFVLPEDQTRKMVFIAGGIGITPFRSMTKYLIDTQQQRDIVLLYAASEPEELTYQELFEEAKKVGLKPIYIITRPENVPPKWKGQVGRLNADMVTTVIPDFAGRHFYLSGPHAMVSAYEEVLKGMGVPATQIHVDFFPGF